ncbi:hypothetical protein NE237_028701 [Protea cynaroides]|uniref:FAD-binding domain-containing protein n=1 Tax=Protea cynaroides TaxID=273540 RepID=A0A9Q0GQR8_9MAGN|nr:hypothetical protein NE237_028701 [Protea cynaroides]
MEAGDSKNTRKPKAVVVGGSIAGLSCAHALIEAGWDVVVLEKSTGPPSGSLTGAGLGLDPLARHFIQSWLQQPQLFHDSTLPLSIDQNQATDSEKKISWTLTRDENFNFRAAHWVHLHGLLFRALPFHVVQWGHYFLSFFISDDKAFVQVTAKVLHTEKTIEIVADLLIAADGSLSKIRQTFLPNVKLRYTGYCAWRGVLDFSEDENSDTIVGIRKAYPELGNCLYFDITNGTHSVLYELPNKRMNWLWYVNQPEPELKGNSVTLKVSSEMIEQLHEEAEKTWVPELARLMKETKEPFMNVIYDCDPLEQLFWDNVVLVGDAAHPTTPHGLRSTNMSILDAAILGRCLAKRGVENLGLALAEFQSIQLPVVSKQVLQARRLGRIKQGLALPDRKIFDPKTATPEECQELQQKSMPFFADVPSLLVGST